MDDEAVKLSKRTGTDDLGKLYELKVAALLALRCVENHKIKRAWFASNVNHAYDLDDVILYVVDEDDFCTAYLMQLKHQDDPKNIRRKDFLYNAKVKKKSNMTEDFSVPKYLKSFLNIKASLEGAVKDDGLVESLRNADAIFYVLYTNRPLGGVYEFLHVCEDEQSLLDTSVGGKKIYGFDPDQLAFDDDFLRQLKLFTEQVHVAAIDELMKKELRRIANAVNINQLDVNTVLKKYLDFVQTSIKGVKNYSFDALTKNEVAAQLTSFILKDYQVKFTLNSPAIPEFTLWNDYIDQKGLVVIEPTESSSNFLKSYVSAKVAEYCKLDNWNQELSRETFYKKAPDLMAILLKTVGERGLTPSDVYEALWLQKKVPLLVEAKTSKDFKRIQAALRLSRNNNPLVIVLTKVATTATPNCLLNLNHLDEKYRNLILEHPITLQGRQGARLGDVLNKSMYKLIKWKDIIDVIMSRFQIGNAPGSILHFFVPRGVSKILFSSQALSKIDSKFLLRGIDRRTFDDIYTKSKKDKATIIFENELSLPHGSKGYHDLEFVNEDFFELKTSYDSTKNLSKHQVVKPQDLYVVGDWYVPTEMWTSVDQLFEEPTCVINANPGMGKTELLNHVALHAPTSLWVLKVDLNKHHDYYKTLKGAPKSSLDHLKYFHACADSSKDELTEKVFLKFVKQKHVLVLLDGFDEISITYKEEVTSIAQSLRESGYKLWVSTRPVTKAHLEEALNTISRTLKPLVIEDQKKFLMMYFGRLAKDDAQMRTVAEFVDRLLAAAAANLNDSDNRFTGLPLQTKLLADVFEKDLKRILETNEFVFNDKFDLIFLYESFLEEKTNIFCEKFGDIYRDMRKFFGKLQQLYALRTVFSKSLLKKLRVKEKLEEYYEDDHQMMHFLQREGVVVIQERATNRKEKLRVSFVHYTFAEFLAAKWLFNNYKKEDVRDLLKSRFDGWNEFLFNVFDRYLAKNLPLYLSIIDRNKSEALNLITLDPTCVSRMDCGGRTIFHLLACYGMEHSLYYTYNKVGGDKMAEIMDAVPDTVSIQAKDDLLGYDALEYAFSYKTFAIANQLCYKSKELTFPSYDKDFIFYNCNTYQYRYLFQSLLKDFVRRDLLKKAVKPHVFIESYYNSFSNLMQYAFEYNYRTVLDVVRGTCHDDDIGVVAVFGSEAELLDLLNRGVDVDKVDNFLCTALHYASYHNNLENATLLIAKKANVNLRNADGDTALHLTDSEKISLLLISAGVDLNGINNKGETALLKTLRNKQFDTAHDLIDRGADLNLASASGTTPLHQVCKLAKVDLVEKILPKVALINAQNKDGKSALHMVVSNLSHSYTEDNFKNKLQIIQLLLNHGIDVNLQDKFDDTALHAACSIDNMLREYREDHSRHVDEVIPRLKAFHKASVLLLIQQEFKFGLKSYVNHTVFDVALYNKNTDWNIFEEKDQTTALNLLRNSCDNPIGFVARFGSEADLLRLLDEGVDVNKTDRKNRTGLYYALRYDRQENAALLRSYEANIDLSDSHNETALHLAAKSGNNESISMLLSAGVDLNHQNSRGQNALCLALKNQNFDTARHLIEAGCDVNLTDSSDMTALFYACELGAVDLVESILPLVSNINAQSYLQKSALHTTVTNCTDDLLDAKLKIAQLLLLNGIDINLQDLLGYTALHLTCNGKTNTSGLLTLLLLQEEGVRLDLKSEFDETPLDLALVNENTAWNPFAMFENQRNLLDLVRSTCNNPVAFVARFGSATDLLLLLDEGIDVNKTDKKKRTGLYYALAHNRLENAKLLISKGASLNSIDKNRNTALHLAASQGYVEIVPVILAKGVDLNAKNKKGDSALILSVKGGYSDIAHLLIEEGADVNLVNASGSTALFYACQFAEVDIVKKMLPAVTNLNAQNKKHQSVLHVLVSYKDSCYCEDFFKDKLEILQLLLESGVDTNLQNKDGDSAQLAIHRNQLRIESLQDDDINNLKDFYKAAALLLLQVSGGN